MFHKIFTHWMLVVFLGLAAGSCGQTKDKLDEKTVGIVDKGPMGHAMVAPAPSAAPGARRTPEELEALFEQAAACGNRYRCPPRDQLLAAVEGPNDQVLVSTALRMIDRKKLRHFDRDGRFALKIVNEWLLERRNRGGLDGSQGTWLWKQVEPLLATCDKGVRNSLINSTLYARIPEAVAFVTTRIIKPRTPRDEVTELAAMFGRSVKDVEVILGWVGADSPSIAQGGLIALGELDHHLFNQEMLELPLLAKLATRPMDAELANALLQHLAWHSCDPGYPDLATGLVRHADANVAAWARQVTALVDYALYCSAANCNDLASCPPLSVLAKKTGHAPDRAIVAYALTHLGLLQGVLAGRDVATGDEELKAAVGHIQQWLEAQQKAGNLDDAAMAWFWKQAGPALDAYRKQATAGADPYRWITSNPIVMTGAKFRIPMALKLVQEAVHDTTGPTSRTAAIGGVFGEQTGHFEMALAWLAEGTERPVIAALAALKKIPRTAFDAPSREFPLLMKLASRPNLPPAIAHPLLFYVAERKAEDGYLDLARKLATHSDEKVRRQATGLLASPTGGK